jgi:hypothetical protein
LAPPEVELAAASRMPPELATRELGYLTPGHRVANLASLRALLVPLRAARVQEE